MMPSNSSFEPDWISAPGDTIADLLEEQGLSATHLAECLHFTADDATALLQGLLALTPKLATRLEAAFGAPAAFWLNRERRYRQSLARLQRGSMTVSPEGWLQQLPLRDMVDFGWIPPSEVEAPLDACLRFFDTDSIEAWHTNYRDVLRRVAFRRSASYRVRPAAVAAWLRQGERETATTPCDRWDVSQFKALLPELRSLTRKRDPEVFVPELAARCAEVGVAVAVVRAPRGCPVSGATRHLSPTKALLLLSFRHLTDDHFWFTFFHEAAHLVLHGDRGFFLEEANPFTTKEEEEADKYAEDLLIPPGYRSDLSRLRTSHMDVIRFARQIGLAAGVVVGQLQHHGRVPMSHLNKLKRRYEWA